MSPVLEIYKKLNALDSITEKLNCLSDYHLQVHGKYRAQNNRIIEGLIPIYKLVDKFKQKHFPNTNDPEFTFWFLNYNAQHYFKTHILTGNLVRRLNSTVGKDEATIEFKKIEKAEKLAHTLVIDNDIDTDSKYKDQKGYLYLMNPKDLPQPEYQTKEIRRVLNGYYESNPTEHSYTVIKSPEVKVYAKHVIFKNYLLKNQSFEDAQNNKSFKHLQDLFVNDKDPEVYFDILKKVDPPIISQENEYLLGDRQKGSIVAWVEVVRPFIYSLQDDDIAKLLNNQISGLNITGRTLRNLNTSSYNKYCSKIRYLLP